MPGSSGRRLAQGSIAALLSLFCLAAHSAEWATGPGVSTRLVAEGDAEPVPIFQYADDWHARLHGGSDGQARLQWLSRYRWDDWSLDFDKNRLYLVEANRDAALLYYRLKNGLAFVPGEQFKVRVDLKSLEMTAIGIGHRWHGYDWGIDPHLSLIRLDGYLNGRLNGLATANDKGDLQYQAQLDYSYSRDTLLDRRVDAPKGYGAALNLSGWWRREAWRLTAQVRDLGAVHVDGAPKTTGVADSQTRRDDSGSVSFSPTLSGREYFQSSSPRLPWAAQVGLIRSIGDWGLGTQIQRTELHWIPRIDVTRTLAADCELTLLAERAVDLRAGFEFRSRWLFASLVSDQLNTSHARSLRAELGLNVPLF